MIENHTREKTDRHVGHTTLEDGTFVSTVLLRPEDHLGNYPLWETMIFGGKYDGKGQRYTSQAEALIGHVEWLAMLEPAAIALEGGVQEVIESLIQVYGDNYCSWDFEERGTDFDVAVNRLKAWAVSFASQTNISAAEYLARAEAIEQKMNEEQRIRDEEYERQAKERRERIEREGPPKAEVGKNCACFPITADLLKSSSATDYFISDRLAELSIRTPLGESAVVKFRNGQMVSCDPPDSALLRFIDR